MEWLEKAERLVYLTNNTCNLSCKFCNEGCDKPMGEHSFRKTVWEYNQNDFKHCVDVLGTKVPRIRLCGGETTLLNPDKINESIRYAKNKVEIEIISNGYNLLGIDYKNLDRVYLDDHIYNSELVQEIYDRIHNIVPTHIFYRREHYDVEWMTTHGEKTGEPCNILNKLPMLYKDVLLPCCSSLFYNPELYDIMNEAGWNIYNENILEDIKTHPDEFYRICKHSCYGNSLQVPTEELKQMRSSVLRK